MGKGAVKVKAGLTHTLTADKVLSSRDEMQHGHRGMHLSCLIELVAGLKVRKKGPLSRHYLQLPLK